MEIAITVLLLIVGLVLIIKGGDFFVDAASWMAEASGIPKLIVGATVVSFATTLPELLVSIFAALDARAAEALSPGSGIGMVDMSIGNAIGSVTANLGLIMGIALVAIPMAIRRKDYMLKMILMLVAAAATVCFSLFDNGVGMVASILLIIIFVIAMYDNIHEAVVAVKGGAKGQQLDEPVTKKAVITNVVKFLIGAVGTVAGAQLLVDNGSALTEELSACIADPTAAREAESREIAEALNSFRMCAHLRQQAPRVAHRRHGRYPGMSHHRHSVCRAHAHHEEILALAGRFNARRLRRLYRAQRHCYGITCNFCNESSVFKKNGAFLCTFQIISS
ncbi:MAG: hypothetical protein BHW36_11625 [Firmicutes bacterium CAG:24053_14]|nr:MAG: hypothetical protein BHW36_11625 [Firmicutes bacterium CAG:24053_14]